MTRPDEPQTPRVDELFNARWGDYDPYGKMVEFARQLELELRGSRRIIDELGVELRKAQERCAELEKDAARYSHMRNNAEFQDRNGPGLYWYLPRWDRDLPAGERLDAAIDAAIKP